VCGLEKAGKKHNALLPGRNRYRNWRINWQNGIGQDFHFILCA